MDTTISPCRRLGGSAKAVYELSKELVSKDMVLLSTEHVLASNILSSYRVIAGVAEELG